jgi:hypothetical protein
LKTRPDAAYGPAGKGATSKGRLENMSVIKSKVLPGFSLRGTMGSPLEAAQVILKSMFNAAPKLNSDLRGAEGTEEGADGSGTEVRIIDAREEMRGKLPAYVFEYTLQKPQLGLFQHTVCVIIARDNDLFTLSTMTPQGDWESDKDKIMTIANSFIVEDTLNE